MARSRGFRGGAAGPARLVAGALLAATLSACLINQDPYKGLPNVPTLDGAPEVRLPEVGLDGVRWVRGGTEVELIVRVVLPIDLDASALFLDDLPLSCTAAGDGSSLRCVGRFEGSEAQGGKGLSGRLAFDNGSFTNISSNELVRADFTPPSASCSFSPTLVGEQQPMVLTVTPTEPLAAPPTATADAQHVDVGTLPADATPPYRFPVNANTTTNIRGFTVFVEGIDRAGNVSHQPTMCEGEAPQGTILNRGPAISEGSISLDAVPSIVKHDVLRAAEGAEVSVHFSTPDAIDPMRSFVSLSGFYLHSTDGGLWTGRLRPSLGDGLKTLSATLVDEAGNTLEVQDDDIALFADFTPPGIANANLQRLPFFASADDGSGRVRFTQHDPFTGVPVHARLTLTSTEDLGDTPVLQAAGPATGWALLHHTARQATWELTAIPQVEGVTTFTVVLTDEVGNTSDPLPLGLTMDVDLTGPQSSPDVNTPGRVRLHRTPWGLPGQSAAASVVGLAGAAPADAVVVLRNAFDAVAGSATASADGSFGPIPLAADVPEVLIAYLDDAGNPGPTAQVRDVSWTASLGGKLRGLPWPNPHQLSALPRDATGRPQATEVSTPADAIADGALIVTEGRGSWVELLADGRVPPPRNGHAAAYDPVREQVLVFGGRTEVPAGSNEDPLLSDTWLWDGQSWSQAPPAVNTPTPREGHRVAFCPNRQQLLLFGGYDGFRALDDTWAWDGARWVQLLPEGNLPPRREGHILVTDPVSARVVLFGGIQLDSSAYFDDTWVWDGARWEPLSTDNAPSRRHSAAATWDPWHNEIVLFSGVNPNNNLLSDVWVLQGHTWTRRNTPAPRPLGRLGAGLVADVEHGAVVLAGGLAGAGLAWDPWTWDGESWTAISAPPDSPAPLALHSMTHHAASGSVVTFGGVRLDGSGVQSQDDTWVGTLEAMTSVAADLVPAPQSQGHGLRRVPGTDTLLMVDDNGPAFTWSGFGWVQRSFNPRPATRIAFSFADNTNGGLLLYGGQSAAGTLSDLWRFTGTAWQSITQTTPRPPGLTRAALALDPASDQVVLHGGYLSSGDPYDGTWFWDGAAWAPHDGPGPGERGAASLTLDPERGELVLFGGDAPSGPLGDTWVWTGTAWQHITSSGPEPRFQHTVAYDPDREELVLFGGSDDAGYFGDTWVWDGELWHDISPAGPAPRARAAHALAWDPVLRGMVLHGGNAGAGRRSDTWLWRGGASAHPTQLLDVDWTAAIAPDAQAEAITLRWVVGGTGRQGLSAAHGAAIEVWDVDRWRALHSHDAPADQPQLACASVTRSAGSAPAGCAEIVDDALLDRLFVGAGRRFIHARAATVAPSGARDPAAPSQPYARLATDTVTLQVDYRRAAPTP